MGHGGKRKGAGRKVGTKLKTTLSKQAAEEEYRLFMLQEKLPLWMVQREKALGIHVVMVHTENGPVRVTDADQIEHLMKTHPRGDGIWWIEAKPPDAAFVKEINSRTLGLPTQPTTVSGPSGGPVPIIIMQQLPEDE